MTTTSAVRLKVPVTERDHAQGPSGAAITLVEYGDFECPDCGRAYPIVEELRKRFPEMRFVFRYFPLAQSHPHAQAAAEAAEAAGAQNRFWEMHRALFTHQRELETERLAEYAGAIGVEVGPFRHALAAHTFRDRVREDFLGGARSGVNGTPTFFINGERYDGFHDLASLSAAIEAAARSGSK